MSSFVTTIFYSVPCLQPMWNATITARIDLFFQPSLCLPPHPPASIVPSEEVSVHVDGPLSGEFQPFVPIQERIQKCSF